MCESIYETRYDQEDPATQLATLIHNQLGVAVSMTLLRKFIRNNWPKIKNLAHRIHDEETSDSRKLELAAGNIGALDATGIMNVVKGHAVAREVNEAFELIVQTYQDRKIKEAK